VALTPKQAKFVEAYLVSLNQSDAARKAGCTSKRADQAGYELMRNPEVKAAVDAAIEKRAKKAELSAQYVLETIMDTVERCRQATPVLDEDGNETGEYQFQSGSVLKGCELLGKNLKLWTDKVEHSSADALSEKIAQARARRTNKP
jgi:phage terminase small subunit